ncbi:amidohydrolase family protein [Halorarius litoreus]|uniref:amidohydrolase family protein n=1 Tax=Halorarius litoreus TaxID=2962676 RepID=UPI0020CBA412|nr:amidohydrolase family protein [Halorarius litoreus]
MIDDGIIDIWCNPFTPEGLAKFSGSQAATVASELFNREYMYDVERTAVSPDEFVADMDEHGVEQAFIPALQFGDPNGGLQIEVPYDLVADLCATHPDRFKGMAGINPRTGMEGVALLEEYVEDHGFIAGHLEPYGWDLPLNHRKLYPFYAKCAELGVPVVMQVGHSAMKMPSKHGKPLLVDDLAIDFPGLDIVASHTGWPWSQELEAIAWKHDNVYMATTAHAPKYWEENVVQFIRTRGQDKSLFGTDWPVLDYEESLSQIEEYGFDESVVQKLLSDNARTVFDV